MKFRSFQGIPVSEIGLGTWQLGSHDWGTVDHDVAMNILIKAAEAGITFFDTADIYGGGLSEERICHFLKRENASEEKLFIATKLGRFGEPGGDANYTLDTFRKHTENSLRRLGVDALDLTQLHCIPPQFIKEGEVFEWLRILKKEGKIKHFGASVESDEVALECLKQDDLASLQIIFNIFRQKPIETVFEKAKEKGVAIIVRLPLASGLLSGKFSKDHQFPANDHRHFNADGQLFNVGETFSGIPFEKGVALANALKTSLPDSMNLTQMALRWILDFDAVTTIIPGATKADQVLVNASTSELPPLSSELHEKLKRFYAENAREHIRGVY